MREDGRRRTEDRGGWKEKEEDRGGWKREEGGRREEDMC